MIKVGAPPWKDSGMSTDNAHENPSEGWSQSEVILMIVGCVWAIAFVVYAFVGAADTHEGLNVDLLFVVIALVPIALFWIIVRGAHQTRQLETEIDDLTDRLVSLRQHVDSIEDALTPQIENGQLIAKINEIAQAQEKTDTTLAVFMSSRSPQALAAEAGTATAAAKGAGVGQAALLPLHMVNPQAPLSHEDFIRAANFPRNAEDRVGFAVLRLALQNDKTSPFIQASQDILTLLSQEGIYMDDLTPEKTRAETWRHFGQGKRGKDIAPLGGIRDRSLLETVASKMREDTVFRDAVHHFLRKFDLVFTEFCEDASDDDLAQFSETRSGRAFMLLGRIAGTFD